MLRPRPAATIVRFACVLSIASAAPTARAQDVAPGAYRPPPPPEQPVPFSHAVHTSGGASCTTCHAGAETADRATLPPVALCMSCHATVRTESLHVQKLAGYQTSQEDVPWRRVYRLPTFVYFSHKVHVPADTSITCEACHGVVREMTVMQKVKDTSMATCVACHTERSAPVRCDSCHEPR